MPFWDDNRHRKPCIYVNSRYARTNPGRIGLGLLKLQGHYQAELIFARADDGWGFPYRYRLVKDRYMPFNAPLESNPLVKRMLRIFPNVRIEMRGGAEELVFDAVSHDAMEAQIGDPINFGSETIFG